MSLYELFKSVKTAPSNSKHKRPGWINVNCPYCGKNNNHFHLGYHIKGQYFSCFSCGKQSTLRTFNLLLGLPYQDITKLLKSAKSSGSVHGFDTKPTINKKPFILPTNLIPIKGLPQHQEYLKRRGFDWKNLVNHYNIKGTSLLSKMDNIDLSWRIFIPIYDNGDIVTYQTRAIGKSNLPYIACPKDREKINIKSLLFPDEINHTVYLTEGIFDCWKVRQAGFNAICGFGVGLSPQQIKSLSNKRIIIFYDGDIAGRKEAEKIKDRIEFINNQDVLLAACPEGKDPGTLSIKKIQSILGGYS